MFEDKNYSLYWTETGHFPFLVTCGEERAGFALLEQGGSSADIDYHMAEFFIVRKFRPKGVAGQVARGAEGPPDGQIKKCRDKGASA